MKRILVAVALVLVIVSLSGGQTIHNNTIEQTVMDAEHRWEEALKRFDSETMQSLLAEDDVQTDFRGVVQDKASWIQGLKQVADNVHSGVSEWEISFDEEKVRAYGDVAIVTGKGTFKGHGKGGTPVNRVIRFTNVWAKRAGALQLVNYQATLQQEAADHPPQVSNTSTRKEVRVESSTLTAESELRAVMAEMQKASMEGDETTVANSMADDYLQTDISGYRQDKTTWLKEYFRPLADLIKAGKFHWDEYERTNLQFRIHGDCAIITGDLQLKGAGAKPGPQHTWLADPTASFSGTLHFTHVYMKQNGKWLLAALHNQMAPSSAK